jgi:hypothetical protein
VLLNTEQLKAWCGYERKADIERWLRENRIPWRRGKNGELCTTLEAINDSLKEGQSKEVRF